MANTQKAQIVGLVANTIKDGVAELVPRLVAAFDEKGVASVIEDETAKLAGRSDGISLETLASKVDIILALGGDGTILQLVHQLGGTVKPIAAINVGRLGFLTCARTEEMDLVVNAIASGDYVLSPRSMLKVVISDDHGPEYYALNEAALSRSEVSTTITLEAKIDGNFFSQYSGDGLIVATPTGSTAYSFSAGGAIVDPEGGVFLLTPICPHALANRSMVVPDRAQVEVTPLREDHQVALTIDGRFIREIPAGTAVRLSKAPFEVSMVMLPGQTFFDILREKLRWHGSNV
jgi:NAD+ kinase